MRLPLAGRDKTGCNLKIDGESRLAFHLRQGIHGSLRLQWPVAGILSAGRASKLGFQAKSFCFDGEFWFSVLTGLIEP
jgi:hypothetical protein